MSIYVPSTPTFHPHVLRCGRHRRSTLTASAGTGMVRLAVVRCLHARARSPGGAKQPYGVRPARTLPGQRAAAVSQAAPQKPLRTVRRLFKATGSTPARGDGPRPATPPGNRDPGRVGATAAAPHRPSSCLARRAGRLGGRWSGAGAYLHGVTGPGRGGQSKANGVGHATHRAKGIRRDRVPLLCGLFVRSPWLPQFGATAPRAGPVCSIADLLLLLRGHLRPRQSFNASGTSGRRRAAAFSTPGRRPGRSWPPGWPGPSSCRASAPDARPRPWPPAGPAASGTPLR